jgi:hypothetical protein
MGGLLGGGKVWVDYWTIDDGWGLDGERGRGLAGSSVSVEG